MKQFDIEKLSVPGEHWFHPSIALLSSGLEIMTVQQIRGTDCYTTPVFFLSENGGKNWSVPQEIPPFSPKDLGNGLTESVADIRVFPLENGACIVFGCTIFYSSSGNVFWSENKTPPPQQRAVYTIRHKDGGWSPLEELRLPVNTRDCRTACTQIVSLTGNELLIPIYFEAGRCTFSGRISARYACITMRTKLQGGKLLCMETGNILKFESGRGFCEPSVTHLADQSFSLTLRAEDGHGYCCTSADGLHWSAPQAWKWEDGTPLEMSSTQQHWLRLGRKVYLVYTRHDDGNEKIFRYRAPLYLAEACPQDAVLYRSTEQIVFPRLTCNGEEVVYGNFHVAGFSPDTAVITDAALAPAAKVTTLWIAKISAQ